MLEKISLTAMIKAAIIDDVPQAIETLKEDLRAYCPEVEVIGQANGVVSGAKLLNSIQPDVVFLDIQMPDGSGFDLLEILPNPNFKIIFTTASDAFAIKAFRFSAVDYLLKPVDPDELMAAVQKLKELSRPSNGSLDLLKETMSEKNRPERIALHTQEKISVVTIADIVRCESSGNYTQFFFVNGEKLLVTRTLKEYDQLFRDHNFARVHQSHLVNTR
ncbi:MAG: response regulator, partial [Bacteroidota bacterium]